MNQAIDLHWLPPHADARAAIAALRAVAPSAAALDAAATLAAYRLDFMQTLQLDRALVPLAPLGDWPETRLALLGNATMEHLLAPSASPVPAVASASRRTWAILASTAKN